MVSTLSHTFRFWTYTVYLLYLFLFKKINHYAPVSQANLCNMTFAAGNLFLSH